MFYTVKPLGVSTDFIDIYKGMVCFLDLDVSDAIYRAEADRTFPFLDGALVISSLMYAESFKSQAYGC
jgi:hypothetical protein